VLQDVAEAAALAHLSDWLFKVAPAHGEACQVHGVVNAVFPDALLRAERTQVHSLVDVVLGGVPVL